MYGSTARYGDKTYAYYCCVHSLRRDGKCTARRVKADEMEARISGELLALMGDVELTEDTAIPGRNFSEDINRTVEQMTHLYKEIQLEALAGEDVTGKQKTLQRAQAELARLHAFTPIDAHVELVRTGQTLCQRWESLDTAGRNEFLRSNGVRAVVSRDELPQIEHQAGPIDIPRYPQDGDHRQTRPLRRDLPRQPGRHAAPGQRLESHCQPVVTRSAQG